MQANVNVSGGWLFIPLFCIVGYMNQDGIYKYSDMSEYNTNAKMERYNFRTNIDVDIRKDVKLMLNLGGIIQDLNFPEPVPVICSMLSKLVCLIIIR